MELSPDQMKAIAEFADVYKGRWKQVLRQQWERATAVPVLQALRNTHGPAWLEKYRVNGSTFAGGHPLDTFRVERYGKTRFFAVRDAAGTLVCVCVYRRGAEEVAQRLQARDDAQRWADANGPAPEIAAPAVWVDPMPWLL